MILETQTQRIKRLGNPEHIWNGQSNFNKPIVFPANEPVVIPGTAAAYFTCAACGAPLGEHTAWGSLLLGHRVIVNHINRTTYALYHPDCAPAVTSMVAQPQLLE